MVDLPIQVNPHRQTTYAGNNQTILLDNSMFDENLVIPIPFPSVKSVLLQFQGKKTEIRFLYRGSKVELSGLSLLLSLPPQATGKLLIKNGNQTYSLPVKRAGLVPAQFSNLAPLYGQIADDIKTKGYFLATVPVVLWDASFTGEGRGSRWANGNDPNTNLNWGNGSGVYHLLKHSKQWKLVKEESFPNSPIRRVVFAQKVSPGKFWQLKGITSEFTAYLVLLAFASKDIENGYRYFGSLIKGAVKDQISLAGGKTFPLADSRIVGMATHYIPEGFGAVGDNLSASRPKGVFMASCFSAQVFGPLLVRKNIFPLFLSGPTTSSEGFLYLPIIEGLIAGDNLRGFLRRVDQSNAKYHPKQHMGERQYPYPGSPSFEKTLSRLNYDWDGDGIPNWTDPDPIAKNPLSINGKITVVHAGKPLEIVLPKEAYPLFFSQ